MITTILKSGFIFNIYINIFLTTCIIFFPPKIKADQNDLRLVDLFKNLKSSSSIHESLIFEVKIWDIWMEHKNQKVMDNLFLGLEAMKYQEFEEALGYFSIIIEIEPEFAEGWNKRATVLYLMGRFRESEDDVLRTLELEPRHFGALSGQGLIRMSLEDWSGAIKVLEEGLKINPHMPGAKMNLNYAKKKLKESMT